MDQARLRGLDVGDFTNTTMRHLLCFTELAEASIRILLLYTLHLFITLCALSLVVLVVFFVVRL